METIAMRKKCINNEIQIPICLATFQTSPENMRHINTIVKGNNIKTFYSCQFNIYKSEE